MLVCPPFGASGVCREKQPFAGLAEVVADLGCDGHERRGDRHEEGFAGRRCWQVAGEVIGELGGRRLLRKAGGCHLASVVSAQHEGEPARGGPVHVRCAELLCLPGGEEHEVAERRGGDHGPVVAGGPVGRRRQIGRAPTARASRAMFCLMHLKVRIAAQPRIRETLCSYRFRPRAEAAHAGDRGGQRPLL